MADEITPAAGDETAHAPEVPQGPSAGEAWGDVVAQMEALSSSIGAWARAAYNDPDFQRHAGELKGALGELGAKIGEGVESVADSEFGQRVSETADKVGASLSEGADKVTQAAAPHVASAFSTVAGVFQKAASRVDEAVRKDEARTSEPAPAPPVPPIPPDSAERE